MNKELTAEQEVQLTNDLSMAIAIIFAQQEYLKSIGKLDEAKKYVQKFMADLNKEEKKKNGIQN